MSLQFHTACELEMAAQQLTADMAQGFTILTPSGRSFTLLPGKPAERLRDELALQLQMENARRVYAARSTEFQLTAGGQR
jgi:hypothetical protein